MNKLTNKKKSSNHHLIKNLMFIPAKLTLRTNTQRTLKSPLTVAIQQLFLITNYSSKSFTKYLKRIHLAKKNFKYNT